MEILGLKSPNEPHGRIAELANAPRTTAQRHQNFQKFQEAIDGCLTDLPTKHQEKLATLLTHNFQTWNDVSLLNA